MSEKILTVGQAAAYFTKLANRNPNMPVGVGRMEYIDLGFSPNIVHAVDDGEGGIKSADRADQGTKTVVI